MMVEHWHSGHLDTRKVPARKNLWQERMNRCGQLHIEKLVYAPRDGDDYGEDQIIGYKDFTFLNDPKQKQNPGCKRRVKEYAMLHDLHQLEAVQLMNLAPKTVVEAKNLIPTLKTYTYDQIW